MVPIEITRVLTIVIQTSHQRTASEKGQNSRSQSVFYSEAPLYMYYYVYVTLEVSHLEVVDLGTVVGQGVWHGEELGVEHVVLGLVEEVDEVALQDVDHQMVDDLKDAGYR